MKYPFLKTWPKLVFQLPQEKLPNIGALTRISLYLLAIIAPLVLVAVFRPQTDHSLTYELGKSFAVLGFTILIMQFVLATRLKWIEGPFGLDIVIQFHRYMGVFATILLLVHPILLALGGKGWFFLISLDSPWYIWLARIVLLIMLLHTIFSSFRRALRLEFQKWLRFHNILALLLISLGFLHSWYAGGDLAVVQTQVLWMTLLSLTFFIYIYHRMLRHMRDTQADIHVVLFYANRARKDIIFQKELREIAGGDFPRLQVIHILSRPDEKWDGETGHLSGEKIRHLCDGNQQNKAFYLCEPPIMTRQIIRDLGVSDARIHFEKFSF